MRNAVNKMTNLIDPYTENHFLSFIENLSDMELSVVLTLALSGCHWLRRPLHGSLHRSWVDAVYPTLKLICDFWPSKFSHYPSRPVPLPEVFVTTRPDPVPKSKTTTRQSLSLTNPTPLGPFSEGETQPIMYSCSCGGPEQNIATGEMPQDITSFTILTSSAIITR